MTLFWKSLTRNTVWIASLLLTRSLIAQHVPYEDLFRTDPAPQILSDTAFAPPDKASTPSQVFEGDLELVPPQGYGYGEIVSTHFDELRHQSTWKHLPPFRVTFVQDGTHLIPVQQGLIYTGSLEWNLIVGPGSVWQEPGDHGYARASLPFALIERGQNCTHNGELMFLFDNAHEPHVSQVRYQITQETCDYMKANFWGQVPARYDAHPVPNAAAIRAAYRSEVTQRIPRKPLSALTTDYPDAHMDVNALLRGRRHPEDVTWYGVYFRGVNYVSSCPTRHGEYPFCAEMRAPSYSTAKSAFTGMAMMHLGALYGPETYKLPLNGLLPSIGQDSQWNMVTLTDALDMSTGRYLSSGFEKDEDGPELKFLVDESLKDKLKDALLTYPQRTKPGNIFVYQSHDPFLATVAMQHLLQQKAGSGADLFDLVCRDIYRPLNLSAGMMSTIRTGNDPHGQPAGYFGLFFIQDDVAKIGRFLNESGGRLNGKQVLDAKRLQESLFRDPTNFGLTTNSPREVAGTVHYNHAFWGRHFTRAEYPRLGCEFWASYLSGYGGITIALLPNNAVFYVFSDADEWVYNDAILETSKLAPMCPAH